MRGEFERIGQQPNAAGRIVEQTVPLEAAA
jgi:hypothetical protein